MTRPAVSPERVQVDDDGAEVSLAVVPDYAHKTIKLVFGGRALTCIGMPAPNARLLAALLNRHVDAIEGIPTGPPTAGRDIVIRSTDKVSFGLCSRCSADLTGKPITMVEWNGAEFAYCQVCEAAAA